MPISIIETPKLIVRDAQASDVDAFFGYMQQELYWRDVPSERPTAESITALVDASLLDQAKQSFMSVICVGDRVTLAGASAPLTPDRVS